MIKYVLKLPDNAERTTPVVSPVFTRGQARPNVLQAVRSISWKESCNANALMANVIIK